MINDIVLIKTIGELTGIIEYDKYPCSPRDDYSVGKIVCFHSKYNLSDSSNDFSDFDELNEFIEEKKKANDIIVLPIYLYDHSGITIKTTPFSCPWDSGLVGVIYCTSDSLIKAECGHLSINKDKEALISYMEAEVKEYSNFLEGSCYIGRIYRFDESIDYDFSFMGDIGTSLKECDLEDGYVELFTDMKTPEAKFTTLEEYFEDQFVCTKTWQLKEKENNIEREF